MNASARLLIAILLFQTGAAPAAARDEAPSRRTFRLANSSVACVLEFRDGQLEGESLIHVTASGRNGVRTDGGFSIEVMWTGWQAPGMKNNAENPLTLTAQDFRLVGADSSAVKGGSKELRLMMQGRTTPFRLVMTYHLDSAAFFVRRKFSLIDSTASGHYWQFVSCRNSVLHGKAEVSHRGGFGQPVALLQGRQGLFFGMEYPAADNTLIVHPNGSLSIRCRQEIGHRVTPGGVESDWSVFGLTPDRRVKYWFFEYLDRIRVAPLRPYALYNSWYDLRAPEMVKDSLSIMNESNVLRMVRLIRRNMIEKHKIRLDAFVLDDGWDTYRSGWELRSREFPHGLKPIGQELAKTGTVLGLWLGPTGGYSHHEWRLDWMRSHGYEITDDQLCLAGRNYSELFRKRTTDFVQDDGVRFFKWDGIQFSCSDPTHGHPVGIFSRRAVMESLIEKCRAVRQKSPDVYLNITSGTWLSPWWVQYANQIWMQGSDYGFADIPSWSKRDAAMTYRDLVLHDDFAHLDFWFPIANLMTHGIIKGNLQRLGSAEEPLEKFTDDALLYFARGISMYELYISPDLLTDGEWNAISQAMLWARDRFPILVHTQMVGGDPERREPYGYTHFRGPRGIVAVRNPWIARARLTIGLSHEDGLDSGLKDLVLERVYPTRWISPRLYRTGEKFDLPLEGYETAVYEIFPLSEAKGPLVGGARFAEDLEQDGALRMRILEGKPVVLNPKMISEASAGGVRIASEDLPRVSALPAAVVRSQMVSSGPAIRLTVRLHPTVSSATVALLLRPDSSLAGKAMPKILATVDGASVTTTGEQAEGAWKWCLIQLGSGEHAIGLVLPDSVRWRGRVSAWVLSTQLQEGKVVVLRSKSAGSLVPMPPAPWAPEEVRRTTPAGSCRIWRE